EGIEPILDLIRRSNIAPVFVVSFHAEALKEVKRTLHHARTGLIYAQPAGNPLEMAGVLHADLVLPRFSLLSASVVEESHHRRLMVVPWTLNREEEIRIAVELQVDGFATDDPCKAKKVLQEIAGALE
ncbi:MAG: glycerophosphodiester phosphodiesterase, partial [Methanomicrobiales archaeon]|nr:glycerophosphodiester phosphodiesterase [Methanomicrobiales archaeon]